VTRPGRVRGPLACACAAGLILAAGCGMFGATKAGVSTRGAGEVEFEAAYRMILEGHYEEAIQALSALAEKKSGSNARRPDAMFWLAYAYGEQGLLWDARFWYGRYLEKYPHHRYANTARERLKEFAQAGL